MTAIPAYRGDSEVITDLGVTERVVKVATTLLTAVLASDPHQGGDRRRPRRLDQAMRNCRR